MLNNPSDQSEETADASFADILNKFETSSRPAPAAKAKGKGKGKGRPSGPPPLRGTVVGVAGDFCLIDYGGKSEGVIPSADLIGPDGTLSVKNGDILDAAIT